MLEKFKQIKSVEKPDEVKPIRQTEVLVRQIGDGTKVCPTEWYFVQVDPQLVKAWNRILAKTDKDESGNWFNIKTELETRFPQFNISILPFNSGQNKGASIRMLVDTKGPNVKDKLRIDPTTENKENPVFLSSVEILDELIKRRPTPTMTNEGFDDYQKKQGSYNQLLTLELKKSLIKLNALEDIINFCSNLSDKDISTFEPYFNLLHFVPVEFWNKIIDSGYFVRLLDNHLTESRTVNILLRSYSTACSEYLNEINKIDLSVPKIKTLLTYPNHTYRNKTLYLIDYVPEYQRIVLTNPELKQLITSFAKSSVPNIAQPAQSILEKEIKEPIQGPSISREWANNWANQIADKDQIYRGENYKKKSIDLVSKLKKYGFEATEEGAKQFLNTAINPLDVERQNFYNEVKDITTEFRQNDINSQQFLQEFIDNNKGQFPGLTQFDPQVIQQAWIILQHADNDIEFQKKGFELMALSRKNNPENIPLIYFYFLTDRILINSYNYQICGTQNKMAGTIRMSPKIQAMFQRDPVLICKEYLKEELPKFAQVQWDPEANASEILKLCDLADIDTEKNKLLQNHPNRNSIQTTKGIRKNLKEYQSIIKDL